MRTNVDDLATTLTKREYFAAKTLEGFISNGTLLEMDTTKQYDQAILAITGIAVDFAEALIKALNEEKPCT